MRAFGSAYAHKRGLSPIAHGPAKPKRGALLTPEEIIQNDLLREKIEGELAHGFTPQAAPKAKKATVADASRAAASRRA